MKAGDRVTKGAPLFLLDDRDLRSESNARTAALELSRRRLGRLDRSPRPEEVPLSEARVREAAASLADVQNQLRLIESVTDKRAVREEDVLRRREAVNVGAARLEEAKAALALLRAGTWSPDLDVAKAEVASAEAQVQRIQTDIERMTMRAPVTGMILQLNVRAGEYAQVGQLAKPLLIMGEVNQLNIRADVDENEAWRVKPGSPAEAAERGNSSRRASIEFVRFEPYVVPKKSLTGESTERVDTRVLQAIYRFKEANVPFFVGQQMDVFIEGEPEVKPARVGFAAVGFLFLSGCAIGPEFHAPNFKVPTAWKEPAPYDAPVDASVVREWWKTFQDPVLDLLIVHAAKANYDVRLAAARIVEARAAQGISQAALQPSVNTSDGITRVRGGIAQGLTRSGVLAGAPQSRTSILTPFETNVFQLSFDASWELDFVGGVRRGIEAATLDVRAAEEARSDALVTVLGDVGRTYMQLRGAQRRLSVVESNVEVQRQLLDLTLAQARAGIAPELDSIRARAQLLDNEASLAAPIHAEHFTRQRENRKDHRSIHVFVAALCTQDAQPLQTSTEIGPGLAVLVGQCQAEFPIGEAQLKWPIISAFVRPRDSRYRSASGDPSTSCDKTPPRSTTSADRRHRT